MVAGVLEYRVIIHGNYVPVSARVFDTEDMGQSIAELIKAGWRMSGIDSRTFFHDDPVDSNVLHECRVTY